jgi:hypothetical protein
MEVKKMPKFKKFPNSFPGQLSKDLIDALNELKMHEKQIMEGLQNPMIAKLFAEDPAEALKTMNVPTKPVLSIKLKEAARAGHLNKVSSYFMPNGQTIRPNVRIHFVKGGGN